MISWFNHFIFSEKLCMQVWFLLIVVTCKH
jgi:hypothetical protein